MWISYWYQYFSPHSVVLLFGFLGLSFLVYELIKLAFGIRLMNLRVESLCLKPHAKSDMVRIGGNSKDRRRIKRMQKTAAMIFFLSFISSAYVNAQSYPSQYEVICPATFTGSLPMRQTQNPSTGLWRAVECVDALGRVSYAASVGSVNTSFSNITTGTNTTTLLEGSGGSLLPSGSGQIGSSEQWFFPGLPPAVLSQNPTGGSLSQEQLYVVYTLNSPLGETNPSMETNISTVAGCSTSHTCQVVVTKPTIPAGFTGYTVYNVSTLSNYQEVKQIANSNCVNINTDCIINANATGTLVSNSNTAFPGPTPLAASLCPFDVTPTIFIPRSDGNFYPYGGITPFFNSVNGPTNSGTFELCDRFWVNDSGKTPPGFNNSLVDIRHLAGSGGLVNTNQQRGLSVYFTNPNIDSTAYYGLEGLQAEMDFNGTPTITGSPDGEVSTISVQLSDGHTNIPSYPSTGVNGIRVTVSRGAGSTSYGSCVNGCLVGVQSIMSNLSTLTFGGAYMASFLAAAAEQSGAPLSIGTYGFYAKAPSNFPASEGFHSENFGVVGVGANFKNIASLTDATGMQGENNLQGPLVLGGYGNGGAAIGAVESIQSNGTGTGTNLLAKLVGAPSLWQTATTADTAGVVMGICTFRCTTSSPTIISTITGTIAPCVFDGATTAGDWVIVSTTVNGNCHDAGATVPATTLTTVGRVLSTNAGAGTYNVMLQFSR